MKKTFFTSNIGIWALLLICIIFLFLGVFAIVSTITTNLQPYILFLGCGIAGIIISALWIYEIYCEIYNHVIFYDNKIIITGEKTPTNSRTQFQDEIIISQIKDVRIIISNKNSKKEHINLSSEKNEPRIPYFEFEMENGEKKWMLICFFSKKQLKEMLHILSEKTGKNFDYDELIKNRSDPYQKTPISFWDKL